MPALLTGSSGKGGFDDLLGLALDALQVVRTAEALRVDFVNIFRAGRACREPAVVGDDLEAADGGPVARRRRQLGDDGIPGSNAGNANWRGREIPLRPPLGTNFANWMTPTRSPR